MSNPFKSDPYPGGLRILFVGDVHGSHAQSWIGLLAGSGFNLRAFGSANGVTPQGFKVHTYSPLPQTPPTEWHRPLMTNSWPASSVLRNFNDILGGAMMRRALRRVIASWRPHIVHTLGVFPASEFYASSIVDGRQGSPFWVVQARGGPDIEVNRMVPGRRETLQRIFQRCDSLIADTDENLAAAVELGLDPSKRSPIGRVPGTGGIDVESIAAMNVTPPSARERLVLVPKAYEHLQSKMLPVLEAIRLCFDRIAPCRFVFTAVNDEVSHWVKMLPPAISQSLAVHERIPRAELFQMMAQAKIVLAPSLMDGIPNTMMEAMAIGAVPVVSPLPTIVPHVADPDNVFFARNLYPEEIADALVRALDPATPLDVMARRNLEIVRRIGDTHIFADRIRAFYREALPPPHRIK